MAGRFSTVATFIMIFQLVTAFFTGIGLFGVNNISTDNSNDNPTSLLSGLGGNTCGFIPIGCLSVALVGGAVASSVLFFGAWAFSMSLWIGFYGAALAEISLTLTNLFHLSVTALAPFTLLFGAIFLTDLVYMYGWRDNQHN